MIRNGDLAAEQSGMNSLRLIRGSELRRVLAARIANPPRRGPRAKVHTT